MIKRVFRGAAAALLLTGCGGDTERDGADRGGAGSGGSAGSSGTGGMPSSTLPRCEDPWPGYVGCRAEAVCQEPTTERGEAAVGALCLPELGVHPVTGPCPSVGLVGRCYLASNDYWTYYYDGAPAADCVGPDRVWCSGAPGVTTDLAEACRSACDEARPSFASAPQCAEPDAGYDCPSLCYEAIAGLEPACATTVIASIVWPQSGCSDFECLCLPPRFESADPCRVR